jgi:hypothetical protein
MDGWEVHAGTAMGSLGVFVLMVEEEQGDEDEEQGGPRKNAKKIRATRHEPRVH